MFRATLAWFLLALPVIGSAVPVNDEGGVTPPLADQSASGSLDVDDSFDSTARNLVIAYRPGSTDFDAAESSLHFGEKPAPRQPRFIVDDTLRYLSTSLLLVAAGLTSIWYLSRYGRRSSKRHRRRSGRIRHAR